jgi:hypothetical protein
MQSRLLSPTRSRYDPQQTSRRQSLILTQTCGSEILWTHLTWTRPSAKLSGTNQLGRDQKHLTNRFDAASIRRPACCPFQVHVHVVLQFSIRAVSAAMTLGEFFFLLAVLPLGNG